MNKDVEQRKRMIQEKRAALEERERNLEERKKRLEQRKQRASEEKARKQREQADPRSSSSSAQQGQKNWGSLDAPDEFSSDEFDGHAASRSEEDEVEEVSPPIILDDPKESKPVDREGPVDVLPPPFYKYD